MSVAASALLQKTLVLKIYENTTLNASKEGSFSIPATSTVYSASSINPECRDFNGNYLKHYLNIDQLRNLLTITGTTQDLEMLQKRATDEALNISEIPLRGMPRPAMVNLALCYWHGIEGVCAANLAKALQLFEKAADLGDAYSLVFLGTIFEAKIAGFPEDLDTAIKYYQKALPHPHALTRLIRLAMNGQKIPKFEGILSLCEDRMKLPIDMSDCAHAELLLTLSSCYETGQVHKKDFELAKQLLQKVEIAAKTNPEIATKFAAHLLAVTENFKNVPAALKFLHKASAEGSTAATLSFVNIARVGLYGTAKNSKLAIAFLSSPLLQNSPYANYLLALEYMSVKNGAEFLHHKVAKLLQKAANALVPQACIELAKCYLSGENTAIPKDVATGLYYLDKLMRFNYPPAFHALSECYLQGKGVPKDLAKASECLLKLEKIQGKLDQSSIQLLFDIATAHHKVGNQASYKQAIELWQMTAKQDHADSHINLYGMYYYGKGVTKDIQKGVQQHLMKAADLNHSRAFFYLGRNYDSNFGKATGFEKNQKLAVKYHEKGVAQKYGPSFFGLALCYAGGNGVSKNLNRAVELIKAGAELNDIECKEKLASFYKTGLSNEKGDIIIAKDLNLAIKLWKEAAELGATASNYELGLLYERGSLTSKIDKNPKLAYEYFEKGMKKESLAAKCKVGICLYKGFGVPQDQKAAFEIFQQLNAAKHPEGIYWQGVCFASGGAVEQDLKIAFELYKQAAHLNYAPAACIMGYAYRYGLHDHHKDHHTAFNYFSRAASANHGEGLFLMGTCYEKGLGLDPSLMSNLMERYRMSYVYYQKAAELGFVAAAKPRDRMHIAWQLEKQCNAAAHGSLPAGGSQKEYDSFGYFPASNSFAASLSGSLDRPPILSPGAQSGSAASRSLAGSAAPIRPAGLPPLAPVAGMPPRVPAAAAPRNQSSAAPQQSSQQSIPIVSGYSSIARTPLPTGTVSQNALQQAPVRAPNI